ARYDKNDIITEVFKSKAILVGSSTIGNGILSSVAGILEEIKGLRFKNKSASAFGSYGWSGESPKIINELLEEGGFKIIGEGIRELWNPDKEAFERCIEFGKEFVKNL
ncbi:MAG: flavodoxin domain-containing protein, partial [Candidatus Thorarchaeota archaeon]